MDRRMTIPNCLLHGLRVPVIAAPMFLISTPDLVVECCRNGVIGTFPALNQRTTEGYDVWLTEISERLASSPGGAAFGVNLVAHRSNARLAADLEVTKMHRVPLVITSLGIDPELIETVHGYGGLVFHDVTTAKFAERAIAAGVDGLIAVSHGAGAHAGAINPFALVAEIRSIWEGPLALGGAITNGAQVAAARMMGVDFAYVGTRFLATPESSAQAGHRDMILRATVEDISLSRGVSGLPANFLRESLAAAGLDPNDLGPSAERNFGTTGNLKPWRDIWAAGQGVGSISDLPPTGEICIRLAQEYENALELSERLKLKF
jgi:nitronate monooxygenase